MIDTLYSYTLYNYWQNVNGSSPEPMGLVRMLLRHGGEITLRMEVQCSETLPSSGHFSMTHLLL